MSYADLLAADMRLRILQLLSADSDYAANEDVLQSALELAGHDIGIDKLRTEVAWLVEQGLATTERLAVLNIVKLTRRGVDVAHGRANVPGVARPAPGE